MTLILCGWSICINGVLLVVESEKRGNSAPIEWFGLVNCALGLLVIGAGVIELIEGRR